MSTVVSANQYVSKSTADSAGGTALKVAARAWFLLAVIGQWIFAFYIAYVYGVAAMRWQSAATTPKHFAAGDTMGNVAMAAHLVLVAIITAGGPLQLIPQIRSYAPSFHRWNGRLYMLIIFPASIAALYLVWIRGTVGDFVQHVGVSLDAVLIMIFAVLAVRYAMARDIQTHRRWALRLFMVVNGVWFFRVGLMLWIVLNHGPAGFDPKTFIGPFISFWSFANYLLPLAVLEIYLRTRDGSSVRGRLAMAAGLVVLTLAMGVGIFVATMVMWLPRIKDAHDNPKPIAAAMQYHHS
ncbi:MAG TPA: DUF2306 domain-containing protein [Thermoanaerobaculia bacterium]|nr:DUF2306 domain-containing protein [Thermoanaerobaculia bacterium]